MLIFDLFVVISAAASAPSTGHDGEIRPLLLYYSSANKLPSLVTGFPEAGVTGFYITELGSITASISSFSYAAVTGILLQSCPLLATAQH
jgi:hypothetical protein